MPILDVPLIVQWGSTANTYVMDCGPSCIAMLLSWKGLLGSLTVNALARETALASSDSGLSCSQVAALGISHGLDCTVEAGLTIERIQAHLAAGRAIVLLVRYGDIKGRQDTGDITGYHFFVAVGDDGANILVNDPDRLYGSTWGYRVAVPYAEIDKALANARDTSGLSRSGIVCQGVLAVAVDHQAETFGALNLRILPTMGAAVLTTMPGSATVNVLADAAVTANGYVWVKVQYGKLVGWCAQMYLVMPTAYPVGYDISHHNEVDLTQLNAAFLWHKVTQGSAFVDPLYAARKAAAVCLWGAYHFGIDGDVDAQVDAFLKAAAPDGKTVLALDLEANPDTSEGSMSLTQAAAFAANVQAITGMWPVLYTNANRLRTLNDGSATAKAALVTLANCPLWVADAGAEVPNGWSTWTFQQYTQTQPDGASAAIDTDRFNGSDLATWWKTHSPASTAAVRVMQVIAADGVNVRAAASANSTRVGGLEKGAMIRVIDSDVGGWAKIVAGDFVGRYVCAQFLGAVSYTRRTSSAMGLYFVGPGGYGAVVSTCRECQPAVVVIANEYKAVAEVRTVSPDTCIVYRETGKDWGIDAAKTRELLTWYKTAAPDANYYSVANEWLPFNDPVALACGCDSYMVAMHVAAGLGLHITVGNLNTGFPKPSTDNLNAITPMLLEAARLGMPLAVHYYAPGGNPKADQDAILWKMLADRAPGLKVIIEEYGVLENDGKMVTGEAFDTFLNYDDLLDDRVLGVAVFAMCSMSWKQCDYVDQLPKLIQHVKTWR
jgi:lysozyme